MNRTIKFRVWDKQLKTFDTGKVMVLDLVTGNIGIKTKQGIYPVPNTGQKDLGINRYVLQQFTGFVDENRLEIYEGDIITNSDLQAPKEVKFQDGAFGIYLDQFSFEPFLNIDLLDNIVVGNIFENKDVLI